MRAGGTARSGARSRSGSAARDDMAGMIPGRLLTDQSIAHVPEETCPLRAAAVQLTATADTAANLATADRLVRAAAKDGASLVVLPEKWSVYGTPDDIRAGAQPLDGEALRWA